MEFELISEKSLTKKILMYLNTKLKNMNYGSAIGRAINSPSYSVSKALKYLGLRGFVYFERGEQVGGNWKKKTFLTKKGKELVKQIIKLEKLWEKE